MNALYPLRFREILRNYGFGDRWIVREFRKTGLPENHRVAETWEVCDRPGESSVVVNGPLAGRNLRSLIDEFGAELLGGSIVSRFGGRFPLLFKFLDCTHSLGEQAHHSDELARAQGLADTGKTEAWYMIRTRPSATIRCGCVAGLTREKLAEQILAGQSRSCMPEYAVRPHDAFLLHAGTMHYSAGGMLFYEILENSDVYINLARPDPSLAEPERTRCANEAAAGVHIEDSFDCRARPVTVTDNGASRTFVVACEHFALERIDFTGEYRIRGDKEKFLVLSQIDGESQVIGSGRVEALALGVSCLVPACVGDVVLRSPGRSSLLKGYVPDLATDIVAFLRAKGIPDPDIVRLGGKTRLNALRRIVYGRESQDAKC